MSDQEKTNIDPEVDTTSTELYEDFKRAADRRIKADETYEQYERDSKDPVFQSTDLDDVPGLREIVETSAADAADEQEWATRDYDRTVQAGAEHYDQNQAAYYDLGKLGAEAAGLTIVENTQPSQPDQEPLAGAHASNVG